MFSILYCSLELSFFITSHNTNIVTHTGIEPVFLGWKPNVLTDRRMGNLAGHTGIEPAVSSVTGKHVTINTSSLYADREGVEPKK